jgi:hypothetical protein
MRHLRYLVISLFFILPVAALSAIGPGDLPETSKWYFHADFQEMRSSDGGRRLYGWLQDEVFNDIRDEAGVDLDKEADFLTAFATEEDGLVVVIEGDISQDSKDKLLAMATLSGDMNKFSAAGKDFYFVGEDDHDHDDDRGSNHDMGSFDDGAYFSFAVDNKLLVASNQERMESLLAENGRVSGIKSEKGALFVMSAERNLVQAGARASDFGDEIGWNSNILRNTEQAALLIADRAGKIAFEAQLVTSEKEMADSLASIVRGLISLQVFNDDLDPEIAAFLQNTSVEVEDNKLTVKVALDADDVIAAIE